MLKRIKAVILGHAVGDALGVPVEFCSREELDSDPVTDMRGWGSYPVPEGCWSDDTSMSLATLESLKDGDVDYDRIMRNFVAWYSNNEYTPTGTVFDIGRTCQMAIQNYMKGGVAALQCGLDTERSNGNGSLMRIHPMALYLYCKGIPTDEAIEIIHATSALTHGHERSVIACGIYAFVLWALLEETEKNKNALRRGIQRAMEYYEGSAELEIYKKGLLKRIAGVHPSLEDKGLFVYENRSRIKSSGYVVDTLEAAIWCLLTTKDYKSCVLKAVNLGDDTDTVAAIAGGLAGAMYGLDGIPKKWLSTLKKRKYIEKMCEDVYASW